MSSQIFKPLVVSLVSDNLGNQDCYDTDRYPKQDDQCYIPFLSIFEKEIKKECAYDHACDNYVSKLHLIEFFDHTIYSWDMLYLKLSGSLSFMFHLSFQFSHGKVFRPCTGST